MPNHTNWVAAWVHPPTPMPLPTGKKVARSNEDLETDICKPADSSHKRLEDKAAS